MSISNRQRILVDSTLNSVVISAATIAEESDGTQTTVNVNAVISLAWILGIRFALAHPTMASEYMGKWHTDMCVDPNITAKLHHLHMEGIIMPITHPREETP